MSDQPEEKQKVEEKPQEAIPTSEKPAEVADIPEDSTERTREQFEKLKKHNRELKEKLEAKERAEKQHQPSVLESLRPPTNQGVDADKFSNLSQEQVDDIQNSFTRKGDDGFDYVDARKLQEALNQANERAKRAEQEALAAKQQFVTYEETRQTREAYAKHPELDPNSDEFDREFYNEVRDKLIAQAYRGEKDLVKAADQVAAFMKRPTQPEEPQTKPEAPKKPDETETQKQQINASDSVTRQATNWDHNQLVQATMHGEKGAIAERLKRSGF